MVRVTEIILIDHLLLMGALGIGRTEVVKQKAREEAMELGKEFVDLMKRNDVAELYEKVRANPEKYYLFVHIYAPTILQYLNILDRATREGVMRKHAELLPVAKLALLTVPKVYGALLISYIESVTDYAQLIALLTFIKEKIFGWGTSPGNNVKVIATMTIPPWSRAERTIPASLRSGMTLLQVDPPTIDEWWEYMERTYGDNWERLTYVYLKMNPDDFLRQPSDEDSIYPTPRGWTKLATSLRGLLEKGRADEKFIKAMIAEKLGERVAARFAALLRTRATPRDLEEIADKPERFFELDVSKKMLMVYALGLASLEDLVMKYDKLIKIVAEKDREFFTLLIKTMPIGERLEYAKQRRDLVSSVVVELKEI